MILICARHDCEEPFEPKTHNQKYHHDDCTRIATNERMMEKYYERRAQKLGKVRICRECGETKLSRYNDTLVCASCDLKREIEVNLSVVNMLASISWQS